MAIIISSSFTSSTQADGRNQVHEIHTDLVGSLHYVDYLASAQDDLNANLTAHAAQLGLGIAGAEINANVSAVMTVGSLAVPTFVYSTQAQNLAALRTAYQSATQTQAIMVGDFLSSLTSGQLQTIFGMTAGQVTTLRTNSLTPAATNAAAIRAAAGQ